MSNQTVELFSGPKIFSSIAGALGYETFTVDLDGNTLPNLVADIRSLDVAQLPSSPLVVWAAPPDGPFNLAQHEQGWDETGHPKIKAAEEAMAVLRATIETIANLKAAWWFIENPYGPLRRFATMSGFNRGYPTRNRITIDHNDYGSGARFLTDVWTNAFWWHPRKEAMSRLAARPAGAKVQVVGVQGRRLPTPAIAEMFEQLDDYVTRSVAARAFEPPKLDS